MIVLDWSLPIRPRKKGTPRDARTYRGARRNRIIRELGQIWQGVRPTGRHLWRCESRRRDGTPRSRYTPDKLRELRRTRR